jgi:putative transposase
MDPQLSIRKILNHTPPPWAANSDAYFITINSLPRGTNQLANQENGYAILESAKHYHLNQKWYCRLLVIMPDHLHVLASFPVDVNLNAFISAWKSYLTINKKIQWQRDFFDHRIRNDENLDEKADYIRQNPVRAGLATKYEDWPWKWDLYR